MSHLPRSIRTGFWSLVASLALLQALGFAQEAALPQAREIVARHVAAIGGEAAYKAVKSVRVRGRFELTGQNIAANFEMIAARPSRLRLHADIPGLGVNESGYDGKTGWSLDPQVGPRLLEGRELDELAVDANFDATLHPANLFKELTTVGRTLFDGHPAFKVRAVFNSGVEQTEYFDVDTGLEIGWEGTRQMGQLGVVPTTTALRDYKKFGPLMQPTTNLQKALFVEQVLHVTSCEYDVVDDKSFGLPAQVRALLK
jgi:hypothetical protein